MVLANAQISFLQTDNLSPSANDDLGSTFEDQIFLGNVLSNDSDPEGDSIVVTAVNGIPNAVGAAIILASGAIVILDSDGSFIYDPNARFNDLQDGQAITDSFEYTIDDATTDDTDSSDSSGFSADGNINAGVLITINGKSVIQKSTQPPIAVNDAGTIRKNGILDGNVLTNDSNPEGGNISVSAVNGSATLVDQEFISPLGARVEINRSGLFSYVPNGVFNYLLEGQSVTENFTYTITNNGGYTATATLTATVQGFNDVPAGFDPAQYGASNPDLIPIYRNDLAGLTTHYLLHGRAENRPIDNFDEFRYIASSYLPAYNGDLIRVFGLNGQAATLQYLTNGFFENRPLTAFDPARYLDSYDDLRSNFGTNLQAATQHFISSGYTENRNPNLFASDLYIASYGDLIQAFHYNLEEGSKHYLYSGRSEGRQITFNPVAYMAKNPDVAAAYNNDPTQATFHYITYGYAEGRMTA